MVGCIQISEGKTDYLPYKKALVFKGIEDEEEQLKKDIQEVVDNHFAKLSHRFDELQVRGNS